MIRTLALGLCLWSSWTMAEEPAVAPAQRVLAAVQAADQARQRLADEQAAWRAEEARLEALLALVAHQTTVLETQAKRDRRAAEALREDVGTRAAAPVAAIEELLRAEAAAFAEALAKRRGRLAPGLVPDLVRDPQLGDDPLTLWSDALRRWRALVTSAEAWGLSLEDARDGAGQPRAVHLLRAGSAALWWVAVDDAEAGMARVEDGQLRLMPPVPAPEAAAIRAAVAMARGRRNPGVLVLPFPDLVLDDALSEQP